MLTMKMRMALLDEFYEEIEDGLFESLIKLRIRESKTRRRIVEEKEQLVQRLNEAERIVLDDLKEQSDLIAETITGHFEEAKKLYKKVTRGNADYGLTKLASITLEIKELYWKLKFPYHQSIFQKLVKCDGQIGISKSCGSPKCKTCPHMKETTIFTSTVTGEIFIIGQPMNCKTQNVIYLLTCSCKKQYVGMTSRALHVRMREHRASSTELSEHLVEYNEYDVIAIESDCTWTPEKLKEKEKDWINKLETITPDGFNKIR